MIRLTEKRMQLLERALRSVSKLEPCILFIWPEFGTIEKKAAMQKEIDAAHLTHTYVIVVCRAGTEQGATR